VVACAKPALLKTLLGSCVSACIYDPGRCLGGMNHFSLPGGSGDEGASTRYGIHAMELLINEIMKLGGERSRLRAKLFGGAKVLKVNSEALNVGSRNARFVLDFLRAEGIEVVSKCLGGASGVRVHFYPHTGKVLLKPLDGSLLAEVARDEDRYSQDVLRGMSMHSEGDVTLF
jgi:chemotaxis receptor (MCP) glutamine deamidase CheD